MTPNIEHLSTTPRTEQAADRTNSDMAFTDGHVIVGDYGGFNIYDVADPQRPQLVSTTSCPCNQHDVSVAGDLLFVSVQTYTTSFENCRTATTGGDVPFAGMRVFDISNKAQPVQVAAVQTCRGSHTHTYVPDPAGESALLYVSGTSGVRQDAPGAELGCATGPGFEPLPGDLDARWRIDIVEVPLDAPATTGPRSSSPTSGAAAARATAPRRSGPSGVPTASTTSSVVTTGRSTSSGARTSRSRRTRSGTRSASPTTAT